MTPRATADEKLERVLHVLPAAARDEGASLDELADDLGVPPRRVLRDLEEVTARAFYHRSGEADRLQIAVDDERVSVWTAGEFERPLKLTPAEALALHLALRARAAAEGDETPRDAARLARELERDLAVAAPDRPGAVAVEGEEHGNGPAAGPGHRADGADVPGAGDPATSDAGGRVRESGGDAGEGRAGSADDAGDAAGAGRADDALASRSSASRGPGPGRPGDVRSVLFRSARERRLCRVRYLASGAEEPSGRTLAPYTVVYSRGRWYVLAARGDEEDGDVRIYRADRVLEARLLEDGFHVPEDFDPEDYVTERGPYREDDPVEATVRYSARVAPWIREKGPVEEHEDGSVTVTHSVSDPDWLVRHVLRYGPEAEVLEPAGMRRRVAEAARRTAEAARRDSATEPSDRRPAR